MKRQFEGFPLQSSRLPDDPSKEYEEPKPIQALIPSTASLFDEFDQVDDGSGGGLPSKTNFRAWSEAELKAFLDKRGEDYDDCHNFAAFVQRAQECERNTGTPAVRPNLQTPIDDTLHNQQKQVENDDPAPTEEDDEIDPLDAFMAEISAIEEIKKVPPPPSAAERKRSRTAAAAVELFEEDDHVAEYLEKRQKRGGGNNGGGVPIPGGVQHASINNKHNNIITAFRREDAPDYNSDEEVYAAARAADIAAGNINDEDDDYSTRALKKEIQPLAAVNHDAIEYEDFQKDFYSPPDALKSLDPGTVAQKRREKGIRVSGHGVPAPVESFSQCGFDAQLLQIIKKAGYASPTEIQCQALPVILSGRDVVGVAKTGSGKTAAFVLPMMVHVMAQRELEKGEGPIAVIAAPTRELAEQIHREARKFGKAYNLSICAAFGGLSKQQQVKEMKAGVEMAVCTPGRMLDLIKAKACTLKRTTYVVLDEADRMFDMGFEPQIRSLLGQIRRDRQTLLFSATMPRQIERLAADALTSPVRISVGVTGTANEDVTQCVHVMDSDDAKRRWLIENLPQFIDDGQVLIFSNQKAKVEDIAGQLESLGVAKVGALHGDLSQSARMELLSHFKEGTFHALVATDVAARGLDIKTLKTVINYDVAKDIDTHVHRVGRTGRAGDTEGVAHTLLLRHEHRAAADLERCLVAAGQEVSEEVHELAKKWGGSSKYSKSRMKNGGNGGNSGRGSDGGGGRSHGQWKKGAAAVGGIGVGYENNTNSQSQQRFLPGSSSTIAAAATQSHGGGMHAVPPPPELTKQQLGFVPAVAVNPPPPSSASPSSSLPTTTTATTAAAAAVSQRGGQQSFPPRSSSFVSSGVQHHYQGSAGTYKPEIILPRQPPPPPQQQQQQQQRLPPVPVMMQHRPHIFPPPPPPQQHQQHYFPNNNNNNGGSLNRPTAGPSTAQSEEVQQAIARAREIAARLSSQAPPKGGGGGGGGGSVDQWKWGSG